MGGGFSGFRTRTRAARELRTNPSAGQTTNRLTAQNAAHRANVSESGGSHLTGEELVYDVLHGLHDAAWRRSVPWPKPARPSVPAASAGRHPDKAQMLRTRGHR